MNTNKTLAACLLATLCLPVGLAFAATRTWSGAGGNDNWSTAANWSALPVPGDALTFAGTARRTNVNDLALSDLGLITFSTAAWNIAGAAVSTTNNFTANIAGTSLWGLDTELKVTPQFNQNTASSILAVTGLLSGVGGIIKPAGSTGQGRLSLQHTASTFTGAVNAQSGVLEITKLAPGGQPSSLGAGAGTINIGSTATAFAATLTYLGIADGGTDRAFTWAQRQTSVVVFNNNSPAGASLNFSGAWVCKPFLSPFTLRLQGSSVGTNTIAGSLSQNPASPTNMVSLEVNGPGTWVFTGNNSLLGDFNVKSGTAVLATNDSGTPMSLAAPNFNLASGAVLDVRAHSEAYPYAFQIGALGVQSLKAGRTNAGGPDILGSLNCGSSADRKLDVAGIGVAGTLTVSSNFAPNSGTLLLDLSDAPTASGGTNDLIVVGGDLDLLNGSATVAIKPSKGTLQFGVPYTIIKYSGALLGSAAGLSVPAPARAYSAGTVSTATAGEVQVTFGPSGLPPANLVWQGDGALNLWESGGYSYNWLSGSTADQFFNGDSVTFNDTSVNTNVDLVGSLSPLAITLDTTNSYTFASTSGGLLSGGTLGKKGSGQLALGTANLYSGGTVVSGGVVSARHSAALGSGGVTLGGSGSGALTLGLLVGNGASVGNAIAVTTNGTGTVWLGREAGPSCEFYGPIAFERGITFTNFGPASSNARFTVRGGLAGTGSVTVAGGGLHTWSGPSNSFAGNVLIVAGTALEATNNGTELRIASGVAIPDTANVDVAAGTILAVQSSESINALTGAGILAPESSHTTLRFGAAGGSATFTGYITNRDVYRLSLVKAGAGTQTLTGDNSRSTGDTSVQEGTLAVNNTTGSGLGSGTVTVAPLATLAGRGMIDTAANPVTVNGRLSVGNAGDLAGAALSVTNSAALTVGATGALDVDLFSGAGAGDNSAIPAAADVLQAHCAVLLAAGSTLNVGNPKAMTAWAVGDKWQLIHWLGAPAGTFTTVNLPPLGPNRAWDLSALYTAGTLAVRVRPPTPTLGHTYTAGNLTLTWSEGFLQSAPEAAGPYTNVPGAVSPFAITDFSAPQKFFRLYVPSVDGAVAGVERQLHHAYAAVQAIAARAARLNWILAEDLEKPKTTPLETRGNA